MHSPSIHLFPRDVYLPILVWLLVTPSLQAQYIPNGDATAQGNCYRLTQAVNWQAGSVWYNDRVDISEGFDIYLDIYLGCKDADGADGMVFVLQPISTSIGTQGGGIGYGGVDPSLAIEIDTWQNQELNDPAFDHIAIMEDGVTTHGTAQNLAGPVPALPNAGNIEDCQNHTFRVLWKADSQILRVYIDCELRISYTGDIINNIFGGDPEVFWGFTSATGGFNNEHRFCLDYISFVEAERDTAICEGGSATLGVGTGSTFEWLPATGLSDPFAENPVASPDTTTTYTVTVTDVCGRQRFDTVTVFVIPDTVLDVLPPTAVQCNAGEPLELATNTFPFADFLWSNGSTGPTTTVTGPGTYTVQVTNFCRTFSDTITVTTRPAPIFSFQDVSCPGGATGSATLTETGLGPYQFIWTDLVDNVVLQVQTTTSPVSTISNLPAGIYLVEGINSTSCRDSFLFIVDEPDSIELQVQTAQDLACFGDNSGQITVQASGGTAPFTYQLNNGAGQANGTFNALAAGTYSVRATDVNGCEETITVTLTQPPQIDLQASLDQAIDCFGNANAAISLTATQGVTPYQYRLQNGAFQASPSFTGLAAGTYTFEVQDAQGCENAISVNVTQPPLLQGAATIEQVDCFGGSNGLAILSGTGGVGGYQFSFQGGAFAPAITYSGLSAGTYPAIVQDSNGCTTNFDVVIQEPQPLQITATVQDVACFGGSTGALFLQGQGGWGSYQFAFQGGGFSANDTIDGLSVGSYQATVLDDSGCVATATFQVNEPPLLEIAVTNRIDVDCLGNNTGELAVQATGGVLPYEYSRDDTTFQAAPVFNNLFAGIYTLTVRDQNGCLAEVDTFITTPTGLTAGVDTFEAVACHGDSSGSLTLTAFGGTGPYRYAWNGDTVFTNVFPNLPAIADTLVLLDANDCIVPIPFSIPQPPPLQLTVTDTRDLACFADPIGEIRLAATGGVAGYQYSAGPQGPQASAFFDSLAAGSYPLLLTDANGCEARDTVQLVEPPQLLLQADRIKGVTCFGQNDGDIALSATGGSGAYLFQLDSLGYAAPSSYANLAGGSYRVYVRDDSACVDSFTIDITEPDTLVLQPDLIRDIACFGGNTGALSGQTTGGTQPYEFRINGAAWQPDSLFGGLFAGSYLLEVRDDSLCTDTSTIQLTEPAPLTVALDTLTDVRCFGEGNGEFQVATGGGVQPYRYSLQPAPFQADSLFTGLGPGTYQVEVRDDSNCVTVLSDIVIEEPDLLVASPDKQDVLCFGDATGFAWVDVLGGNPRYQIEWLTDPVQRGDSALNLIAGTYAVLVTDSLGCEAAAEITVAEPPLLEVFLDSVREGFCDWDNGAAYLSATGGVRPYRYEWQGLPGLDGPAAVDVFGQVYPVTLIDANGCTDTVTVDIPNTPPATPLFVTDPDAGNEILESQQPISFLNQSTGAISYLWEFGDGELDNAEFPQHQYELPGTYLVTLTAWNDFFVCPTTYQLSLTIVPDGQLYYPNAFTPNGDGANDVFFIKGEGIVEFEVMIFDRWGRLIRRWTSLEQGWDGRNEQGMVVQEGVYTFVVRARTNAGARIEHGGTVTLLR